MTDYPKIKALLFMKGYSERIPKKNIKLFCNRPLFHWILDTLTKSNYVDEIIINTDDDDIARSATDYFDVTIHMRPEYLLEITSDEANQIMAYDLSLMENEYFIQTHSTNPLLTTKTLDCSIETYFNNLTEYDSLFSVTPIQKRFFWRSGKPVNHDPGTLIKTQELQYLYEENSCIYIFSRNVFEKRSNRIGFKPFMFPMDPYESIDIDEPFDFSIAEALMSEREKNKY